MWRRVDEEIAKRLSDALQEKNQKADHDKAPPTQVALAAHRK
jgi:hypothetical protein